MNSFLAIGFALLCLVLSGRNALAETAGYVKAMACRVIKDKSETFDELSLFTSDGAFTASGTGLVVMKGGSRLLPSMKTEVAQTIPYVVKGDVVSLNLSGTEQTPEYTSFSAKALADTFLENAPSLKISISGDALELECRSPRQNPFASHPPAAKRPACGAFGPESFSVHGGVFVKKSEAVARGETPAGCEHVEGVSASGLPLERTGSATEDALSKQVSEMAAQTAAELATTPAAQIRDGQKTVR